VEETQNKPITEEEKEKETKNNNQTITETESQSINLENLKKRIKRMNLSLNEQKYKTIENLKNKTLDPFEFIKTEEIGVLLDNLTIQAIIEKNESSFERWNEKYGKKLGKSSQKNAWESFLVNKFIQHLVWEVLCHYGIRSGIYVNYGDFAESLFKKLSKQKIENWKAVVQEEMRIWSMKYSLNEEVLRVLALAVAKFTTKYFYEGLI